MERKMSNAHDFTCSIKEQWKTFMEETKKHYLEDTAAVESNRNDMGEALKSCMTKANWYPTMLGCSKFLVDA
ncbi:hypothetical protein Cni_G25858 [Canna indica]|uniref:Uncharacterized protein n=1 Tax=Canna indica TaxID=4628 RepID=A0AAQ3QMU1_9LILI|nr:hypothetical protein Cni_G25858 [Canna indica]